MASPSNRSQVLAFPEVTGPHESVGGIHETAGLSGYPARDFFAPPGTSVLAPEPGTVYRFSGHDPSEPPSGPGGAWGFSEYLHGVSGTDYFITHLGQRNVHEGQKVQASQVIGAVGDYPGTTPDHVHIGTTGPITATQLAAGHKYDLSSVQAVGQGSAADFGSVDLTGSGGMSPGGAAEHIPGVQQTVDAAKSAAGQIGTVTDAIKFVFSYRGLELIGGVLLVVIGLVGLMREIGVSVPSPMQFVASAAPPVAGPISEQPARVQRRAGFEPESAARDRREATAARQARRGKGDQGEEIPF